MRIPYRVLAVAILATALASCGPKVIRTEIEKPIDLSGRWNDTDSRLVAEEMIKDCLGRPWVNHFNEQYKKDPIVIVGTINNRSHEHIDAPLFIKDLEMNLLNSDKVKFVASSQERAEIREEREDQNTGGFTDRETIKAKGKELGADFMLQGSIHSVKDEIKGKYVILYQVNLELVDLSTNQKVWIGEKKIKKVVEKSRYSL